MENGLENRMDNGMEKKIAMVHGSGGSATAELIAEVFAKEFDNDILNQMEDSALVPVSGQIAVTTDSFVVTPVEFPGGDIGRLAVCGTVNDLLARGAQPRYLTCGFILQEGVPLEQLQRIVHSMARTAREAGVQIVAGDTKVTEGSGELYINTAGVGVYGKNFWGRPISSAGAQDGDVILISGTLGDHHAAILSQRMEIENEIRSDCAPLVEMVQKMLEAGVEVHALRDVTRGGLATVLKELTEASGKIFTLEQEEIPVTPQVRDFCGLLGLDPLYMGNEGKLAVIVAEKDADRALEIMRDCAYGEEAVRIGKVSEDAKEKETSVGSGKLLLRTRIGGIRNLDVLMGEGLPRIC